MQALLCWSQNMYHRVCSVSSTTPFQNQWFQCSNALMIHCLLVIIWSGQWDGLVGYHRDINLITSVVSTRWETCLDENGKVNRHTAVVSMLCYSNSACETDILLCYRDELSDAWYFLVHAVYVYLLWAAAHHHRTIFKSVNTQRLCIFGFCKYNMHNSLPFICEQ
jgi:hypothetical protein